MLPDGTVLVTGGTSGPGFNDPTNPVYPAELWDPATESWRTLASATVPRLYHSAAILLPDGRVLTTGGNDYPTPEAFSPPYLFKGARPTMSAVPSTIGYGQPFSVQTPDAANITKVTLIRITSVTHAFNENQRLSVLGFTPGAGTLDIVAPATANVAPPGHYLLFIVNGNGVPSVGSIVQLGAAPGAATLTSLSPSSAVAGGPAFTLTVNGTGFVSGATVQWNGASPYDDIRQQHSAEGRDRSERYRRRRHEAGHGREPGASASNALTFTITTLPAGGSPALVAAYGFDEGTGPTTADLSGNGNTGAIANATWTASGKFGSALVFNGSNALVTIADAPELNLTTAMTLMAWVKPSSVSTLFTDVIWKDYFAYFLEATSNTGAPGVGAFINGTAHVWVPTPSALTVGAWAHLAATYDGANVRLYVNGVQVGISAQTGTIGTTTTPLWIGGSQYFSGVIDEVRIYNVALTQAQIQADMNTPVGGATPGAGTIQFSAATYSVGENAGTATVTVTRTGGSSGAVSVTFATSNGTATAPGDYTAVSPITVSFANGDTASKTVNIPISDDTTVEANETVNLALTSPTGGATLGSPSTAVLTITDNDVAPAGTIQFSAATYSVGENAGTATVTVTRTGGSSGAVSVTFATSNGTATAPGDYTAVSPIPLASPMAIPPARPLTSRSVTTPLLKRTRRSI